MSSARAHVEWLKLVESTEPFLTLEVLTDVFPQGPDRISKEDRAELLKAHQVWMESDKSPMPLRRWLDAVLETGLGCGPEDRAEGPAIPASCTTTIAEPGVTLTPDVVVTGAGEEQDPELLVLTFPKAKSLDRRLSGKGWYASPISRATTLCQRTGTPIALVTNGHDWALVHARPGETTSTCTWSAERWFDERPTLDAFYSLLHHQRLCGVAADRRLAAMLERSAESGQEVTDQLGRQVREAVEILIQTLDRLDRRSEGVLLEGQDEKRLYQAAVTVMMRLVFLLAAEERGLLLLSDDTYDAHYAVSTLREQLQEVADRQGEEILLRRHDAWSRLLATFRAVHGGVEHEDLRLPAYGGSLFDPDRFPFLEGRPRDSSWRDEPARPLAIDNRTVLHLLNALQLLQVRVRGLGVETRRLSFEALDVEQIGHVYEGLLDHEARRATGPVLGLKGAKGLEPEVPLIELEAWRDKGDAELLKQLGVVTGRGKGDSAQKTLSRALNEYTLDAETRDGLSAVCEGHEGLYDRVEPWAGLIRESSYHEPVVFPPGALYVTDSQDRRASGSHYTPRSLTEEIVRHALDPLVYRGFPEGVEPSPETLISARELLSLRICDLAMGSGAFLVQTCRYLSDKLVEAWKREEASLRADLGPGTGAPSESVLQVTPDGALATGAVGERRLPEDPEERLTLARRLVAERCLYGVDVNPMAVEMAKLSLWLTTLQRDKPFTFVDHALRAGDSLLGVTQLAQLERLHLQPDDASAAYENVATKDIAAALDRARALRERIESQSVDDLRDATEKRAWLDEADTQVERLRHLADGLVGAHLAACTKKGKQREKRLEQNRIDLDARAKEAFGFAAGSREGLFSSLDEVADPDRANDQLAATAREWLDEGREEGQPLRTPFHWLLEYPEIFGPGSERPGFDAIVGNPPFVGGKKISGVAGSSYREYLVDQIGYGTKGNADLVAYMYLRAGTLVREGGNLGLIATNTIAQGDTREVGLDQMVERGFHIYRGIRSEPWPTPGAALEVAHTWIHRGPWTDGHVLEDEPVSGITPYLVKPGQVVGKPFRLAENKGKAFIGSYVLGMGFVLTPEEAHALILKDPRNKDVLYPYLNGQDLNSRPDQSPSRWVINFHDWPLDRESAPKGYAGPVAAEYPDCLQILRERVLPEIPNMSKHRRKEWWLHHNNRPGLYSAIAGLDRVLVTARVSASNFVAWAQRDQVFHEKCVVFPATSSVDYAILQSSHHWAWAHKYTSTLGGLGNLNYAPSDCLETFPWPHDTDGLASVGRDHWDAVQQACTDGGFGLTKLRSLLRERSPSCDALLQLSTELDRAVCRAFGWHDLSDRWCSTVLPNDLPENHIAEALSRLLRLNHQSATGGAES